MRDENYVARGFYHGTPEHRGFVWEAARIAGSHYVLENPVPNNELWLNYYGGPSALRSMSFEEALNQDPGFFKEKLVFVGRKPITDFPGREVDQFGTPYARFQGRNANVGGVYIAATAFMNLMQGTPLQRMSTEDELRLLLYGALLFGGGLVWLRPWWAAGAGLACFFAAGAISCTSVWQTHTWWAWMFVSGVQIPVALAWALFTHTRRLGREKAYLEKTLTQTLREVADSRRSLESAPQPAGPAKPSLFDAADADKTPTVADHTLVRRVGKGGYGEVWLARNAIGMHHVVKVVYREGFNDDGPYEREFRGIQKFMPISRSHPGFVNILQVGRNDRAGCFYYVMEAGDDEKTGQLIDPATYAPKTLGSVLRDGGALAPRDSVLLGMALASALGSLHQQKLIHRDIKPANIIYLNGAPKLADIGLVTDIETTGRDVSLLGTEGYIAPEGPGTPAADVYSLGKVLYEASTGIDRRRFPELPTALYDASDAAERLQLNRIVLRACEPDPADRYATAAEMKADLEDLATRMGILPGGGPPQPGPG
ncbi:MAG TPA: hypothetical protein DCM86_17840 [Verrucomicrobiales bacterium]|nr:hypothetical protein [Verrucomicrobiales bacterium]